MAPNIIIFGPTGGVASFALQYAATKGANLILAMRDPGKPIEGLSSTQESSSQFTRVKADLTDAATVKAAATTAKAHSAFIYQIHGPTGTPRESIQALKDAGVKHVVFLSSLSVSDPITAIPKSDFIPWAHAQTELMLEEIYGKGNFTAVRPGWFASNSFRYIPAMKTGVVKEVYPDNVADYIAPKDIGDVAAEFLLRESPLPRTIDVCGPQLVSHTEAMTKCARAAGREIKVEHLDEEEWVQATMKEMSLPEPALRYLAKLQVDAHEGKTTVFQGERFEKSQKTVKEICGRESTTLDEWIEENKQAFA